MKQRLTKNREISGTKSWLLEKIDKIDKLLNRLKKKKKKREREGHSQ